MTSQRLWICFWYLLIASVFPQCRLVEGRETHLRGLEASNQALEQQGDDESVPYRGIISGQTVNAVDYPWHVKFEGNTLCGGTIVGDGSFVLTAAHCVDDGYTPPSVRVGSSFLNTGGSVYSVTKKWIHPDYEVSQLLNDVALLKIATNCFCTPSSVLLNRGQDFPSSTGYSLEVIGFGRTTSGGHAAGTLQQLGVDFVSNTDCENNYGSFEQEMKMCADKDGAGTCQGDSGSPLLDVDPNTGQRSQVGIVSYGRESCASRFPDYYARVSYYVDWIESTISTELATNGPDRESVLSFLRRNGPQWMQTSWHQLFEP